MSFEFGCFDTPLISFMKKLAAGVRSFPNNINAITTKEGQDQWSDIAAAWRAAGKPTPSAFKEVDCPCYQLGKEAICKGTRPHTLLRCDSDSYVGERCWIQSRPSYYTKRTQYCMQDVIDTCSDLAST